MRDFTYAAGAAIREVDETLEGKRMAASLRERLPHQCVDPDELYRLIELARSASPARLRGFARELQKSMEAEHAA